MKWRVAVIVAVLAAAGLMASVVLGVWTATQTASGTVNATTVSPDLYLCEPGGEGGSPSPAPTGALSPTPNGLGCGSDDSGPDEIIFEGLENLLPSSFTSSNLRLRNIGATPLDVLSAEAVVTETADPDGDCNLTPDVTIRVLGKLPYVWDLWQGVNDNHGVEFANATGVQSFARALDDPRYYQSPYYGVAVHIAAGDYEDFQVDVMLPATAPDACEENVWDITIAWQAVSVSHGP